MLSSNAILATALAAIMIAAVTPGPSFVLVSRISIARSRADGLAAAVGIGLGGIVFATLALAGIMTLLTQQLWFQVSIKVFGGAGLIVIAMQMWLTACDRVQSDDDESPRRSVIRSFGIAFLAHLANPKVIAGYASVFSGVLPPVVPPGLFLSLPIGIFLVELGWYGIVALILSSGRPQEFYLRAKPWIDRISAGFLIAIGLFLIEGAIAGDP